MPAKYVRPYPKGQKNDFRDAEAIAEAVQRPTMKFVATKTADQLDCHAWHPAKARSRNYFRPFASASSFSSWLSRSWSADKRELNSPTLKNVTFSAGASRVLP
jgi:hypothetical protein